MVAWGEVGLDAELPLQVVLFGEGGDVGVGARGIAVFSMGRSRDGRAHGLRTRSSSLAHNLLKSRHSGEQAERTVRIFCLSPAAPYIHNTNNKMAKGHNYNKQPHRQ